MPVDVRIGFTGTRHGMTLAQRDALRVILAGSSGDIHHGDCVGADSDAHDIADESGYGIVIHPPSDYSHRAWREVPRHMMREEKSHFARNRDIVHETTSLIATPFESTEQPKGGTWYTIRYARKRGKPVLIILPDGSVTKS